MGVCCTQEEMLARPEFYRVIIPGVNRAMAEDWLFGYDSVYFAVCSLYPEPGVPWSRDRVFLLSDRDVAFELRMRFG